MVVAVGGLYLNPVPDVLVRASCPFGGGVCDRQELCGALSGGVMVLGALWGRNKAGVNDDFVNDLACQFRRRFLARFGHTQCAPIHDSSWRSQEWARAGHPCQRRDPHRPDRDRPSSATIRLRGGMP